MTIDKKKGDQMALLHILDGAGAGGGGAIPGLSGSGDGGDGGNGQGRFDDFAAGVEDDIIIGDGSGGGAGSGVGPAGNDGVAGLAGSFIDILTGGAGDDIIFGDAFNGLDQNGGLLGGGAGGLAGFDGTDSQTGSSGGSAGSNAGDGQNGQNTQVTVSGLEADALYAEIENNLSAINAGTYSSSYGTTAGGVSGARDLIDGEAGSDHLLGMGGDDVFSIDMAHDDNTVDTIWDFSVAEGDEISIVDEDGGASSRIVDSSYDPFADISNEFDIAGTENNGADGLVYLTDGSQIVIKNFNFDTPKPPCFVTGTLITARSGHVETGCSHHKAEQIAVEHLQRGDQVKTLDGTWQTIRWIGRRAVSARFQTPASQPVCIRRGAFGANQPSRDLFVSPDHAIFWQGVLVQAKALVNGRSVTQVIWPEDFTYYHIELDAHEIIFAEGLATESFVDAQVRSRFDNAEEYWQLYPDTRTFLPLPLPRLQSKRQLPFDLLRFLQGKSEWVS